MSTGFPFFAGFMPHFSLKAGNSIWHRCHLKPRVPVISHHRYILTPPPLKRRSISTGNLLFLAFLNLKIELPDAGGRAGVSDRAIIQSRRRQWKRRNVPSSVYKDRQTMLWCWVCWSCLGLENRWFVWIFEESTRVFNLDGVNWEQTVAAQTNLRGKCSHIETNKK